MKKVALSLMALALVGASAFAADSTAGTDIPAPLTAKITANGWGQVGVDLDTKSVGFKNGTEAKLWLKILDGTSTKGTEGVTGFIEVKEIRVRYDDTKLSGTATNIGATVGDITAKLMFGDLYVKLTTNTDPKSDYSVDGDNDNGGASIAADDSFYTYAGLYGSDATVVTSGVQVSGEWAVGALPAYSAFAGTGFEIGYTIPQTLSITGTIASAGGWSSTDTDGQDFEGSVAVGLLAVEKLTLNGKGYVGSMGANKKMALGGELAYDLGVAAPFAHFNAVADSTTAAADGEYAIDAGAKLPLADGLKAVALVKYNSASVIDFAFTADLAKNKLAGPVGAQFGLWLRDLTSGTKGNKGTDLFVKVAADVSDGIEVWGKTSFDTTDADKMDSLYLKAGISASKLLPLTTFSAEYHSNDFGGFKAVKAANGVDAAALGQFFVQAKVSY